MDIPVEYGDKIILGLQVVLIGMATVFSVLILIWAILSLSKFFFTKKENSKQVETVNVAPVVTTPATNNNDEIVAVIAAAIAMAESDAPGTKFRVVSFKRY